MSECTFPANWKLTNLNDIADWGSGGTPTSTRSDYYNGDVPWLVIGDLNDSLITTSEKTITKTGLLNSSAKIVQPNNILIAMYGSIGKLGINVMPVATNQAIAFTQEIYPCTSNKYLFYFLFSIRQYLLSLGKGATQKNISQTVLRMVEIPLPPLAEQQRIVAKIEELFSELDKGIESLKTAQEQLKVYRQAVLKYAFEGRLTNPDVKEGELPEGWDSVKLSTVAYAIDPQPSHRTPPIDSFGIPYVSTKDFNYEFDSIDFKNARKVSSSVLTEHLNRYKIQIGDFVIGKIGTIGKPVRLVLPQNYTLSANIVLIQPRNINPIYLYYYFQTNKINQEFKQGSNATSQAAFGIQKVRELKIQIPELKEQELIVQEIESRLSVCDKIEESIEQGLQQAEALRQSILKNAFEGKLLPQDPNDEPAFVLLERIKAERAASKPMKKTRKLKK